MKKILCLIIVIAAVFSIVGCSPGETDNGVEKKTVTVVYEADKVSYWTQIKTEFEKKYSAEGYKLSLIPVGGGQVEAKQTTMIAQNNAPDLILGGDVHLLNQYKYLMPLNELIERDNEEVDYDDFIPEITDTLTYNDNIYYLPEFFNVSLLYYNKGIFDQYNADPANAGKLVEYPGSDWTYEKFYSVADALTKRSGNSVSQFGCYSTIGWWGEWLIHVRQSGGRFMNDDGYVCLDTQAAIEGIQRYYDKMYSTNRISNQKGTDDTYGDFSTGVFAMSYGGHISEWVDLRNTKLDWDVQLLPSVNGNQKGGELAISAYGIYSKTKAKTATWELLKFITRKRTIEELNDYPYPSCRMSGKELLLSVPKEQRSAPQNLEVVYQSLEEGYCKSLPAEKYFSYVNTNIVQSYITRILENEFTVEEGLKKATEAANNYIRSNYKT